MVQEVDSGILCCQFLEVTDDLAQLILRDGGKESRTPLCTRTNLLAIETVGVPDPAVPVKTADRNELVVDQ